MKSLLNTSILGAAALLCIGTARADVIDFESPDLSNAPFAPLLAGGDVLTQGTYFVRTIDPGNPDGGTLAGALMNGADPGSCLDQACPTGNATSYIGSFNGGVVHFGQLSGAASMLGSFDAAFLAPANSGLPAGTVGYLAIQADRVDGSHALGVFALAGPATATGLTAFSSFHAGDAQIVGGSGTLTSGAVTDFYAFAYPCDAVSCSAFGGNAAQFAIDNIAIGVSAVPEPSPWMLLALGLGGVAALARRRHLPA